MTDNSKRQASQTYARQTSETYARHASHLMAFMMLLVMALLASCDKHEPDYMCVIPADATSVVSVDMKSIAEKSNLAESPILAFARKYAGILLNDKTKQQLDAIIDDPSLTGLDFSVPVYLFQTPNHYVGLTIKVGDDSMLEEFLGVLEKQNICSAVKSHDDLQWTTIMGEFNMVFDDDALLIMMPLEGPGETDLMLALMQMPYEESFAASAGAEKIQKLSSGDVGAYFNLAAMPSKILEQIKPMIPAGVKYSDVQVVAGLEFIKGEADLKMQLFSDNSKAQKLIDEAADAFQPVDGNYLGIIPEGNKMWLSMGLEGDKALEQLKKIPQLQEKILALNMGIDFDNIVRAIDGDVLVVADSDGKITLTACLGNTDFTDDIDYWMQSAKEYGIDFRRYDDEQFKISAEGQDVYFAVHDKDLYISEVPYWLGGYKEKENLLKNDIVGRKMFALIDPGLKFMPFNKVIVSVDDDMEITVRVQTQNVADNVLKEILNSATKSVTKGLKLF